MQYKKFVPVIGLEVHVELNTASKMFCPNSSDYFGKEPNSHTCPVCLGLPGALPYTNKCALESCIKIGLALGCQIAERTVFERKNYFYPDLPKGFQISQYRWPLCTGGEMEVEGKEGKRRIRINRVHQEEDTAKLIHQLRGHGTRDTGHETWIDFNRSGVPLVEIVTEPGFTDIVQIRNYSKKLQQIVRYLGVSNADMEKGDMRLEANVSLRSIGRKTLRLHLPGVKEDLPNYRVELKNINSFRFMVAAVEYEIERQTQALRRGEVLEQETRGWDENKKRTFVQRSKEEARDYRYFPEPDIPPLVVDKSWVESIRGSMPELPEEKRERFIKVYGLREYDARVLVESKELADYFEEAVKVGGEYGVSASKIANSLVNKKFNREEVLPAKFIEMIKRERALLSDSEVEKIIDEVVAKNSKAVEDYKRGKEVALQFLVGQVMSRVQGKADPRKIKECLPLHLEGARVKHGR